MLHDDCNGLYNLWDLTYLNSINAFYFGGGGALKPQILIPEDGLHGRSM